MAYDTSNPPRLVNQGINGQRSWEYVSADAIADVNTAGYFTDGYDLGMRVNDDVKVIDTATPTMHICIVNAATSSGGIDLSDGLAITATDTD